MDFWQMTPAEVNAAALADYERRRESYKQARDLAVTQAWLAAVLSRQKRLPRLEKLLNKQRGPAVKLTAAERRQKWQELNTIFAGREP